MMGFVEMRRTIAITALVSMILTAVIPLSSNVMAGLFDEPYLTMRVEPEMLKAHVDQSEGDLVKFDGSFDVVQGSLVTSSVVISADVSTGWNGAVDPNSFEITGTDSKEFWVTVMVPPGASADRVCSVVITARLTSTGFDPKEAVDSVEVTVERYVHLSVTSVVSEDTVERGGTTTFECDVTNRGNGEMTFWLTAESVKGLNVKLDEYSIPVPAGETRSVTATVTVGSDMPSGTYNFVINVMGETSPNKPTVQDSVSFTVEVPTNAQVYRGYIVGGVVLLVVVVASAFLIRRRRRAEVGEDEVTDTEAG